jgi:DNA-binding NarL/FixJ family response regulator
MILALNVLVADDHAMVREGLKLLLSTIDDLTVLAEAADATEVLSQLDAFEIDLLVLDLGMPGVDGVQFISHLRLSRPRLRILVVTASVDPDTRQAAIAAGADGFLTKHGDSTEIARAIAAIRAGKHYVSENADTSPEAISSLTLTRREREMLVHVARGFTTPDIARQLGISPLTARKHRENLMRKLDIHTSAGLAAFAVRLGIP